MNSASADPEGDASVRVVENTHTFETDDDGQVWCGGYAVIDEDGNHDRRGRSHHDGSNVLRLRGRGHLLPT